MKMSDHFEHGLKAENITQGLNDTTWGLVDGYGIATTELKMKAAAHAINCHDELVEALTAIKDIKAVACGSSVWVQIQDALAKARGEK